LKNGKNGHSAVDPSKPPAILNGTTQKFGIKDTRLRQPIVHPTLASWLDRRSAYSSHLLVPKTKSRLGDRAFSNAAQTLWNSLPLAVKTSEITLGGFRSRCFKYLSDIAFS